MKFGYNTKYFAIAVRIGRDKKKTETGTPVAAQPQPVITNSTSTQGYNLHGLSFTPNQVLVVDKTGQKTLSGNAEKYMDSWNFDKGDQKYIRGNFEPNWQWTEEEFGLKVVKAELVPVKYEGNSCKTTTDVQPKVYADFENGNADCDVLCKLTVQDLKTKESKECEIGVFAYRRVSLGVFAWDAGLVCNADGGAHFRIAVRVVLGRVSR